MVNGLVLIVCNDIQISNSLADELLPALGYEALIADDARSTLWIAKTTHVDLILMNTHLQDMSGIEVLKQLKFEGYDVPSILMQMNGEALIPYEYLRFGVVDYLKEPLNPEELNACLTHAFTNIRLRKEKSCLANRMEEQTSWMKVITEVGKSITASLDLDEVLRRIVEAGVELTDAEEGFIALLDEESGQLYLRAVLNIDEEKSKTMQIPVSDSLVGEVIRNKRAYRTKQTAEEPPLKVSTGYLVYNLLHTPIISRDKVIGVLSVDNHECKKQFTEVHEFQLNSLADYAAIAIENANLYQQAQQEIQDRAAAEEKLLYDSYHDSLTGLANRTLLIERLKSAIQHSKESQTYIYAVLFLDLDRFKDVNDSLGHVMGDQLLIRTAQLLKETIYPSDTIARLGGDEFVILLEDIGNTDYATQIAERVHELLRTSSLLEDHELYISTSIGVVFSLTGYQNPEDVLRDADIAMYTAKAKGKACYQVFDLSMRQRIINRIAIEADLRQAIDKDELQVIYQPIVSLEIGRIAGIEALLRWEHPQRGYLSPSVFIPIAEEMGLIAALDRWVLRKACQQLKAWQDQRAIKREIPISVNLSGAHISQPNLVGQIDQILVETKLDSKCLVLEITENAIMENNETTIKVFKQLQKLGVQTQIDDFGVGYSSLSYLSNFPINALKIDKSFIHQLTINGNHRDIVQAILSLANSLGIKVIAEGVENNSQLRQLQAMGCKYAQGYYFSEPIQAEEIRLLLKQKMPILPVPV